MGLIKFFKSLLSKRKAPEIKPLPPIISQAEAEPVVISTEFPRPIIEKQQKAKVKPTYEKPGTTQFRKFKKPQPIGKLFIEKGKKLRITRHEGGGRYRVTEV